MECIFDKEKLEQVLVDFYNSTGIDVVLYNSYKEDIVHSAHDSSYCNYIRGCGECIMHCNQSDLTHMKEAFLHRQTSRYSCHAGLMEMIFPIVYDGVLIAYIQIGQFRDAEQVYSSADRLSEIAERYGLSFERLRMLYEELPIVSEEKLNSLCNIINILVKSFWVDGLITYNRSMLSVKIERYIEDHLSENVGLNEICSKFYLSKNAAYRLFRNEFQTTVNDFIIKKRLKRAQELLQSDPDLNITQISYLCGFSDYNYFIRLFKKQVGKTPLQFRKLHSQNGS